MTKPKVGVFIATPMRHWAGPESLPKQIGKALRELADHPFYRFEFAAAVGGLCRARNNCVHEFLKTDCTWYLPWDDDLDATAADVLRLLSHKQPIVGGLYCRRAKRPVWVANFMPAAEVQTGDATGLLQVVELGGGFKVHHRKVFTELARLCPDLAYVERETGEAMHAFYQFRVQDRDLMSEDYYLDFLCRSVGIAIFADTKIKLHHKDGDGSLYPSEWPAIPGEDVP